MIVCTTARACFKLRSGAASRCMRGFRIDRFLRIDAAGFARRGAAGRPLRNAALTQVDTARFAFLPSDFLTAATDALARGGRWRARFVRHGRRLSAVVPHEYSVFTLLPKTAFCKWPGGPGSRRY